MMQGARMPTPAQVEAALMMALSASRIIFGDERTRELIDRAMGNPKVVFGT